MESLTLVRVPISLVWSLVLRAFLMSLPLQLLSILLCFVPLARASPSEFVIPLAKYYRVVYNNQVSLGMHFRMMFENEESGTRREQFISFLLSLLFSTSLLMPSPNNIVSCILESLSHSCLEYTWVSSVNRSGSSLILGEATSFWMIV